MKKISVIIPVYNGEKSIEKCLKSIFEQTYKNLEIIVIDDGSKDNSYRIICDMKECAKDVGLEYIPIHQNNAGVAVTRNYGIEIASGEYIAFIDQDDWIEENYFEQYMSELNKETYDIIVGGYKRIDYDDNVLRQVKLEDGEWSKYVVMAPWAHIYSKSYLLDNDITFLSTGIGEDVYFNILAYSKTEKIRIINSVGYMWVDNPKSVSNSKQKKAGKQVTPLYLLEELERKLSEEPLFKSAEIEYFFMRYICWYLLFTVRSSFKKDIDSSYKTLKEWLKKNYPNYNANSILKKHCPKGEIRKIYYIVKVFYFLDRCCLLNNILKLLAMKNKRIEERKI